MISKLLSSNSFLREPCEISGISLPLFRGEKKEALSDSCGVTWLVGNTSYIVVSCLDPDLSKQMQPTVQWASFTSRGFRARHGTGGKALRSGCRQNWGIWSKLQSAKSHSTSSSCWKRQGHRTCSLQNATASARAPKSALVKAAQCQAATTSAWGWSGN